MGRKPVDQIAAHPKPQGRDAIWAAIRAQRSFTRRSIRDATDANLRTIGGYFDCLMAAEIISRETNPAGVHEYTLVRDCGRDAPRLRSDGSEVTQGRATEQLWRSMNILKRFTIVELVASASTSQCAVSKLYAQDYCRNLVKPGYLKVVVAGDSTRPTLYLLANRTGPKPPQIQRIQQVFDPNLNKVVEDGELGGQS